VTAPREALAEIAAAEPVLLKGVEVTADGVEGAPPPAEPAFDRAARRDIQGNIVPGFNKDHQHFLFFRIRDVGHARRWVAAVAPMVTSMDEALEFVREHRARRLAEGVREPEGLAATWVNVAFSHVAVTRLVGAEDAALFADRSFRQGLAARSTFLGDPTSPDHPGHRDHWRVGGPDNEADVLVIVAADRRRDLDERVALIKRRSARLDLLFEQRASALPGSLRGHEHFGFKDGVSQPGVRGWLPDTGRFVTPRHIAPAESDYRSRLFGLPGQVLVWPGQFLLGEQRQDPDDLFAEGAPPDRTTFPAWARRGSYLVCRRLRQDVQAFRRFTAAAAARTGLLEEHLAALLVGRWRSGAPLARPVPDAATAAALAGDPFANNHFLFDDDTRRVALDPATTKGYPGDTYPQALGDVLGTFCPHFAHIRKTNPRDVTTEFGKPHDSLLRMILRRGIAYGDPLPPAPTPAQARADRGLMFLCYGATIEDQFEFLTRRWSNSSDEPNEGGHDPVIGQRDAGGNRERFVEVPTERGRVRITLDRDWVVPTGGGYFFAPPISALTTVLGGTAP
jgi:Dyp-type peroxidase family